MGSEGYPEPSGLAARAKAILLTEPGIRLGLLYGSAATGRLRAASDVDIAVLLDRPMAAEEKLALAGRLERDLGRSVDVVDLYTLSGTILKQVLCHGRVLVRKDPVDMVRLVRRMIYNQADMMPYVRRTLHERQRRFVHG